MEDKTEQKSAAFEARINYVFKNKGILNKALTHSSRAYETGDISMSNERMEFLGDAVLDFIVSDEVYKKFPDMNEGRMTEIRAQAVCEKALAEYASRIELGSFLMLGKGEEHAHGERRPSILADAFEAVVAAVYLDGGMGAAKKFVSGFTEDFMVASGEPGPNDYKTILQEIIQKNKSEQLSYILDEEIGPAHDKSFTMSVLLNSNVIGKGSGKSKKEAAQAAAKEALTLMGVIK